MRPPATAPIYGRGSTSKAADSKPVTCGSVTCRPCHFQVGLKRSGNPGDSSFGLGRFRGITAVPDESSGGVCGDRRPSVGGGLLLLLFQLIRYRSSPVDIPVDARAFRRVESASPVGRDGFAIHY